MNLPVLRLQHSDVPFSADASSSFTVPARFYHDAEIYQHEKEAIFYRNWVYAGHASQLTRPGDYLTTKIHEQNIFVVRNRSDQLQAFHNVCQHRGHELLTGTGHTNVIVCPYHAWAYDFDGSLKAARNTEQVAGFRKCDFTLKEVRVEQFCGLVFINLDPDAVPLKDQTGELEQEIRQYCPSVDNLVFAQRDSYDAASNWKVMVDNFLECYHCDPAHRDFVDLVDMDTYRTRTLGIYSSQISQAPRTTDSNAFKFETGEVEFGYAGWFLWPNLTIWAYPGEANLSILQMNPAAPERTIEFQDWFIPSDKPSKQLQDAMDYQKNILQPEDISLCESVQRGLKSRGYNQGRLVVDPGMTELSEHAVHHFQNMVVNALGAELGDHQ